MDELDNLMTLAEAAEALGVAPSTLRHQVQAERFRARLFGKTWITTKDEVERYRRTQLGQAGRHEVPPMKLAELRWPNNAAGATHLWILGFGDTEPEVLDRVLDVAEHAIDLGAFTAAEVLSRLWLDPLTRTYVLTRAEAPQPYIGIARDSGRGGTATRIP